MEAAKYQRLAAGQFGWRRVLVAEAERDGRTDVFTYSGELTGIPHSDAPSMLDKSYTITAEVRSRGRGRGDDRHRRRPLRRLWFLPAQGQAGVLSTTCWTLNDSAGKATRSCAWQAHDRVRLQVRRPGLRQGRHGRTQGGRQGSRQGEDPAHDSHHHDSWTRPSTSAATPARRWTTRTTRCRSSSPANSKTFRSS